MLNPAEAERIARDWLKAWNSHDLEAILSHYAEGAELTSPFVVQLLGNPAGIVRGKENLRMYFSLGLSMFPDLHLELIRVFTGVNSLVVYYRGINETLAAEVMVLNPEGQVIKTMAHYSTA
jgi:hypothetical protein|uniref:Nuclear transport factor 2 family protein n=1 Tax=Desulfobacca acetoxidans TaxID=60893 RepID=A0A7C3WGH3_9BACT